MPEIGEFVVEPNLFIPYRELVLGYLIDDELLEWVKSFKWWATSDFYLLRSIRLDGRRRSIYLHRELVGLKPGDGLISDHRNRNKFDCRLENLRITDTVGNARNRGPRNPTGFTGVHRQGVKFKYDFRIDGCRYWKCGFLTAEEANEALLLRKAEVRGG